MTNHMNQDKIDDVPTATELVGEVTAQHGMIRAAFHAAKTGSDEAQQTGCRRLLQLLAMHEAAEQLTVHRALAAAGGGPVGVGDDRLAEEQQTIQLVERLQSFDYRSYEYDMQLGLLEEAVIHHAMAEEASELPLFGTLDAAERWATGRAMRAVATAADDCPIEYGEFSAMLQDSMSWLREVTQGVPSTKMTSA